MTNQFPVPQDNIEQGLLAAALSSDALWFQVKGNLAREDFTSQQPVFSFIEQYLIEYGNLPTVQLVSTRFDWHPPVGDFAYWYKEMQRYATARSITSILQEGFNQISEPDKAMDILLDKLSRLRANQTNHIQAYDSSAMERYDKYLLRNEYLYNANAMIGMPTGMKILDDSRMGWTPGNMTGLFARPGVGKSWWLMWQAAIAWYNGYNALIYSGEMPANQFALRADVIVGALMGCYVDYNQLIIGHPDARDNYAKIAQHLSASQRWWIYDSINDRPATIGDLGALVRQHNPDIILTDGISLLRSERTSQVWEQMKETCYGYKHLLTVHEIPGLVTHQAVNSNKGRRTEIEVTGRGDDFIMPSLNDAAFGDSFVQACSDVISMVGDPTTDHVRWYSIRKHRERGWLQQLPPRMAFAWNPRYGQIIDLSDKGYNPEAVSIEARKVLGLDHL